MWLVFSTCSWHILEWTYKRSLSSQSLNSSDNESEKNWNIIKCQVNIILQMLLVALLPTNLPFSWAWIMVYCLSPTWITFIASRVVPQLVGTLHILPVFRVGTGMRPRSEQWDERWSYGKGILSSIKRTAEEITSFLPVEMIMSRCYIWNCLKGMK